MGNSNKLSKIEVDAIKHRYQQGECVWSLTECFEVEESAIRYHCRGLPRPKIGHRIDVEEVMKLRSKGYSLAKIASGLGFNPSTVTDAIKRAGKLAHQPALEAAE